MFESTRNYDNPRVSSVPRASPGEKDSSIFPWHSFDARTPPSLDSARLALCDLRNLLHPPRDKGHRPKVTGLTSILKKRLSWMEYFLHAFIQGAAWSAAALKTVQFVGKGPYMSRKVREWSKAYIQDRKNLPITPQPKGQGVSLMAVDFVSADYGWLRSRDGTQSARILFRAGKARDGYFTNDEIIRHAEKAMMILEKDYQDDDHVFVFDNASTHQKRADSAISARQMPKGCRHWGVDAPVRDAQGKLICGPDGKPTKQKVRMADGFHDGAPQEFYWPEGHEKSGLFKGMATILTERGFDVTKLKAQSRRFMDAYHKGLNGSQAAWAAKKYRGHRVLPDSILTELDAALII
ncbi:hypothetical protein EV424DRAFT_1515609 [Suillus variegatus]|nr:hypothetical protein EV424DRAFT_1515609 [Suillus variegatus]